MVYDKNRQQEALDSQVRIDGVGEDPAVKALLSDDFLKMPDREALNLASMLQEIIRGQKHTNEEILKLADRMEAMENQTKEELLRQQKFLETVSRDADKLRMGESQQAALRAQESAKMTERINKRKANAHVRRLELKKRLDEEPKVPVISAGEIVTYQEGASQRTVLRPVVVNLYGIEYALPPGEEVMVPESIARRYRDIQKMKQENQARKEVLSAAPGKIRKDDQLHNDWESINQEFNSPALSIPIASNA